MRISSLVYKSAKSSQNKTVAIYGLSFKGDTNDLRSSNAVFLVSYLINKNISVNLYDPYVHKSDFMHELNYYDIGRLSVDGEENCLSLINFYDDPVDCIKNTSNLVFCNNHSFFSKMDLKELNVNMDENSVMFDLYDLFPVEKMRDAGMRVFKLGECNDI